ncbi:MAG: LPS-assembly protein LptD [Bacteroidales bacterium]|nr:LPS-assembly protein LptD [Bacteroidales bacterium]
MSVRYILFLTIATFLFGDVAAGMIPASPGRVYLSLDSINTLMSSDTADFSANDSIPRLFTLPDSTGNLPDTAKVATPADSLEVKDVPEPSLLEDKVVYNAKDSMIMDIPGEKLYLYGNAAVTYQDINLTADFIILDLGNEEIYARGVPDSLGKVTVLPKFVQGDQDFDSDSMRYNFKTKAGIIYHIRTEEADGYLHSDITKRHPNEHIHLKDGKYTTCDADHPHFYLALTKGIVVPNVRIVTGYSYIVVADIPIKFAGLPFGFFPSKMERSSGILMPTPGNDASRGMFLRDFGWYQPLGDYADMTIRGDIYERGSWSVRTAAGYKLRYRFSGSLGFDYAVTTDNRLSAEELEDYERTDFKIRWSHRQDAKANPTQNFSANVNFSSRKFDEEYSYSSSDYLNTTTSSSVNYSKRWPGTPFNLSLSANATQNRQTDKVDMSLPSGSFNMSSIYPLRRKSGTGEYRWYENISLSYSSNFTNEISTYTEVLTNRENLGSLMDSMTNGFQHRMPVAVNFKIGKLITITPSMSYTGVFYTHHIEIADDPVYDSTIGDFLYEVEEFNKLKYEHAINPSVGMSFNPKLYGMFISKKEDSYIEAVRHVMTPSAGFSYTPDMSALNNIQYWDTVRYTNNEGERAIATIYNWYDDEIYSPPSSNGQSGSMRFSLNNNLEMKVRPKNDTTGQSKKISLLDNLNFNTSYNMFADSLKWSDIRMVTGTKLFNKALDIRVNGTFSPYALNDDGKKINQAYIMQEGGGLVRLTDLSINTSFTLRSRQGSDKDADASVGQGEDNAINASELDYIDDMEYTRSYEPDSYVDFDIPWSLSVRHSWSYSHPSNKEPVITNTLNLTGDISFTQNWKIGGQMNYDLENWELSYTSLSIYRDLHCWEMRMTWIPFGSRQSIAFTLQAKGSLLRDLKIDKKPDYSSNRWLQ